MTTRKTSDDVYPRKPAKQRPEAARPLCPQFHPCPMEELDPVRGHCHLSRSPGWFMVPNLDTYGKYCTRSGFASCGWFGAGDAMDGGSVDARSTPPIPVGAWPLPLTVRARQ